ncbi:hypothetical protein LINPERPRIM_LOCUS13415 [Linum perenne]
MLLMVPSFTRILSPSLTAIWLLVHRHVPRQGQYTVTAHLLFVDDVQKAAYAITLSNIAGQVTDGRAGTFYCSSPVVSEAAILASQSYEPITIFSDCLELVNAINDPRHRWSWQCYGYLGGIYAILRSRLDTKVKLISRRLNTKADWVSRLAQCGCLPENWILFM